MVRSPFIEFPVDTNHMHRCTLLVIAIMLIGCEAKPPRKSAMASREGGLSPVQVTEKLNSLFKTRQYDVLAQMICERQRSSMIGFLKAVDHVLGANERLRKAANRRFGSYLTEVWSIVELGNILGPFSNEMHVIDQEAVTDGRMVVIIQEGQNVPLYRAEFVQVENQWRYRPEPVSGAMVGEVETLAEKLETIAFRVEGGAGFDYYMDSFLSEVCPQMHKIITVPADGALAADSDSSEP